MFCVERGSQQGHSQREEQRGWTTHSVGGTLDHVSNARMVRVAVTVSVRDSSLAIQPRERGERASSRSEETLARTAFANKLLRVNVALLEVDRAILDSER